MLTRVGLGLAWGDDCPSFDAALNEAQQAIVGYRSRDADAALRLRFKSNLRQWGVGRLDAGGSATQAWVQGASVKLRARR
jgi:hypothetical protein